MNGNAAIVQGAAAANLRISATAGNSRVLYFDTGANHRWGLVTNNVGEGGSNAGSDFALNRYNDAGTFIDMPLYVTRSTGAVSLTSLLTLAPAAGGDAQLNMNAPAAGRTSVIFLQTAGASRWAIAKNSNAESGANAGSDFNINRYSDAGAYLDTPLVITRSNGYISLNSNVGIRAPSGGNTQLSVTTASPGVPSLNLDNPQTTGSSTNMQVNFTRNGVMRWGMQVVGSESGVATGSDFYLQAYDNISGAYYVDGLRLTRDGHIYGGVGYQCRAGGVGAFGGSMFNFNWTGSLAVWVDNTNIGNMSVTSDERVKHQIQPLVMDTEGFKQIQPISYRFADVGIFVDDGKDHWGFSAQNLMPIMPQAVTGDVNAVQENGDPQPASLDSAPILAQTVLMVQDLMRRVEALEAP